VVRCERERHDAKLGHVSIEWRLSVPGKPHIAIGKQFSTISHYWSLSLQKPTPMYATVAKILRYGLLSNLVRRQACKLIRYQLEFAKVGRKNNHSAAGQMPSEFVE
jgi:hypothetical protein